LVAADPALLPALLALVEPTERGDPMSALRWTCKSLRRLAAELEEQGHPISHTVVARAEFHGEWNYTIHSGNRADRAVDS
jgi:hypothetical protein